MVFEYPSVVSSCEISSPLSNLKPSYVRISKDFEILRFPSLSPFNLENSKIAENDFLA